MAEALNLCVRFAAWSLPGFLPALELIKEPGLVVLPNVTCFNPGYSKGQSLICYSSMLTAEPIGSQYICISRGLLKSQ